MILFASEYVCIQRICIFHHHDFSDWLNISVYLELSLLKLWLGPAKTMPCHKYPCQGLIVISINTFVFYCWHCIFFHLYSVFVFCEPSQDNALSQVPLSRAHRHIYKYNNSCSIFYFCFFFVFFVDPAKKMRCHKYPCQGLIVISINTFVLYSCIFCIVFGICVSYLYFVGPAKTMPCHKYYCQGLIITSINTLVFVPYCISVFVFCICIFWDQPRQCLVTSILVKGSSSYLYYI